MSTPEFAPLVQHFAKVLLEDDYWDTTDMWGLIPCYGSAIRRLAESGDPGLLRTDAEGLKEAAQGDAELERRLGAELKQQEPIELWRRLNGLRYTGAAVNV